MRQNIILLILLLLITTAFSNQIKGYLFKYNDKLVFMDEETMIPGTAEHYEILKNPFFHLYYFYKAPFKRCPILITINYEEDISEILDYSNMDIYNKCEYAIVNQNNILKGSKFVGYCNNGEWWANGSGNDWFLFCDYRSEKTFFLTDTDYLPDKKQEFDGVWDIQYDFPVEYTFKQSDGSYSPEVTDYNYKYTVECLKYDLFVIPDEVHTIADSTGETLFEVFYNINYKPFGLIRIIESNRIINYFYWGYFDKSYIEDMDGDGDQEFMFNTSNGNGACSNFVFFERIKGTWKDITVSDDVELPEIVMKEYMGHDPMWVEDGRIIREIQNPINFLMDNWGKTRITYTYLGDGEWEWIAEKF